VHTNHVHAYSCSAIDVLYARMLSVPDLLGLMLEKSKSARLKR
jgi:hypothetical protein